MADGLGDALEQAERRGLHDLAGDGVDAAVVDGLGEVVVDAGGLQVQDELDVDLERLGRLQFLVVVAVPAGEPHVAQDDPVAHRATPSAGCGGGTGAASSARQ